MSGPSRFLTALVLAAGLVTFVIGCGNGEDGKNGADGSNGVNAAAGSTPEETFKNAKSAMEKDDWKGFISVMTEESQDVLAAGMVISAGFVAAVAEDSGDAKGAEDAKTIQSALDKHGLTKEFLEKEDAGDAPPASPEEGMKKLIEPVKDRAQFFVDVMDAFKSLGKAQDESPMPPGATLANLKVDGDSANGTIEFERDGKKRSEPIVFKKVGGKWLIDLAASMRGPGGPPAHGGIPGDIPGDTPGDAPADSPGDAK